MSELDLLKRKFTELIETAKGLALDYWKKTIARYDFTRFLNIRNFQLNSKTLLSITGMGLVLGFLIAFAVIKMPLIKERIAPLTSSSKTFFPGLQPDGSFVFSNFESPDEIQSWKLIHAKMTLSTNYAWEGAWSAQVTVDSSSELAAITLEELGSNANQLSDWSGYGTLEFYIFHPGEKPMPLTLLVTDLWGKQYKEALEVPAKTWKKFSIQTARISGSINLKKVNQISISSRSSEKGHDLYLDGVRLVPVGTGEKRFSVYQGADYGFSKRKTAWIYKDPITKNSLLRVPFIVKNETAAFCHLCPAEGGIPFPMGELRDMNTLAMRNIYGEEIPFQTRALAYWPDRSIKWLGISFQSTLRPGEGLGYFIDYAPTVHPVEFSSPLKITEQADSLSVNTGVLEVILNKKSFFLFDRVLLDQNGNGQFEPEEEVSSKAALTLNFKGKEFRTDLDSKSYQLLVEERGPQRIVIRSSAWFVSGDGERFCQVIIRYYFYPGKSSVKVSHTLIYTGYPANHQFEPYKDLKLPENEMISAFGIRLPYRFSPAKDEQIFLGREQAEPTGLTSGGTFRVFQKDFDTLTIERDSVPPSSSVTGAAKSPAVPAGGSAAVPAGGSAAVPAGGSAAVPAGGGAEAAAGWLDFSNEKRGITVAIRNFRENFPKAFKLDRTKEEIQIDLWPEEAGPLDLSTSPEAVGPDDYGRGNAFGLAKTHDLLLYFHPRNFSESNAFHVATGFMRPLVVRNNPFWIDATGALGRLYPVDQKYATEERMLDRLFDWANRHPRNFKWYGMLNFGDVLSWWRAEDEDNKYEQLGWHPVGRWGWYNCEGVGLYTGALLQFARTGDWKYFEFGENSARHTMDVDTVHYNTIAQDKRIRRFLNERYSQVGAMHRHSANHWSGRTDEASHTSVVGILLYYYLTGSERAFEVAKEIGEYFLKEPFTYINRPDMVPNRALSNALWGDVLLYQATWDERYKKAAEKIVKIFLKGQQPDGSFLENYNPIFGTWSGEKHELYMAGYLVGALISYHELTQDETVKEMFLRLVRFLAPREYFGPATLHGIAYAYLITHDPFFIAAAEQNLKSLLDHQQFSNDPMTDGLIYEKPIYHRPMTFLSTVPYIFGALEEYFSEKGGSKP